MKTNINTVNVELTIDELNELMYLCNQHYAKDNKYDKLNEKLLQAFKKNLAKRTDETL